MDEKFNKLRFSEFAKAAAVGAIAGVAALQPMAAEADVGSVIIHAGNATWHVNTNITFTSSTSSAFGLSEATLHTAGTAATRSDAFDGVLAWHVNASPPAELAFGGYRSPGGTTSVTANSVTGTVQALAGLNVQGELYFTANKAVVRSILTLQNPTGAPITVTVDNDNNLGSDNATSIKATSNGTLTFDDTTNWVISCQAAEAPPACDTDLDPVLTYAIQGPGSTVRGTRLGGFVNGDQNPDERFTVTVPAGGTSALMYFVQLSDTQDHALIDAAVFNSSDALETAGYLANLPVQKSQILNWGIAAGVPTLSEWAFGGFAAMLGLIGLGSLGLFTRRRPARS